jgi:hypothetical protein
MPKLSIEGPALADRANLCTVRDDDAALRDKIGVIVRL